MFGFGKKKSKPNSSSGGPIEFEIDNLAMVETPVSASSLSDLKSSDDKKKTSSAASPTADQSTQADSLSGLFAAAAPLPTAKPLSEIEPATSVNIASAPPPTPKQAPVDKPSIPPRPTAPAKTVTAQAAMPPTPPTAPKPTPVEKTNIPPKPVAPAKPVTAQPTVQPAPAPVKMQTPSEMPNQASSAKTPPEEKTITIPIKNHRSTAGRPRTKKPVSSQNVSPAASPFLQPAVTEQKTSSSNNSNQSKSFEEQPASFPNQSAGSSNPILEQILANHFDSREPSVKPTSSSKPTLRKKSTPTRPATPTLATSAVSSPSVQPPITSPTTPSSVSPSPSPTAQPAPAPVANAPVAPTPSPAPAPAPAPAPTSPSPATPETTNQTSPASTSPFLSTKDIRLPESGLFAAQSPNYPASLATTRSIGGSGLSTVSPRQSAFSRFLLYSAVIILFATIGAAGYYYFYVLNASVHISMEKIALKMPENKRPEVSSLPKALINAEAITLKEGESVQIALKNQATLIKEKPELAGKKFYLINDENYSRVKSDRLATGLGLQIQDLAPNLDDTWVFFTQAPDKTVKLGLLFVAKTGITVTEQIKQMESTLPIKMSAIFIDEAVAIPNEASFSQSKYDERVKFFNIGAGASLDYAVIDSGNRQYWLIATSKDTMQGMLNLLEGEKQPETQQK